MYYIPKAVIGTSEIEPMYSGLSKLTQFKLVRVDVIDGCQS